MRPSEHRPDAGHVLVPPEWIAISGAHRQEIFLHCLVLYCSSAADPGAENVSTADCSMARIASRALVSITRALGMSNSVAPSTRMSHDLTNKMPSPLVFEPELNVVALGLPAARTFGGTYLGAIVVS